MTNDVAVATAGASVLFKIPLFGGGNYADDVFGQSLVNNIGLWWGRERILRCGPFRWQQERGGT
jgi:hypothetical protein